MFWFPKASPGRLLLLRFSSSLSLRAPSNNPSSPLLVRISHRQHCLNAKISPDLCPLLLSYIEVCASTLDGHMTDKRSTRKTLQNKSFLTQETVSADKISYRGQNGGTPLAHLGYNIYDVSCSSHNIHTP